MPFDPGSEYRPCPIPLEGIELTEDLSLLVEDLAKHVHDTWALQRMADGWTFGPRRDDVQRKHPCLVAYEMLPDSEKEYDRNAASGTLRAIMARGFTLTRDAEPPGSGLAGGT